MNRGGRRICKTGDVSGDYEDGVDIMLLGRTKYKEFQRKLKVELFGLSGETYKQRMINLTGRTIREKIK